MRRPSRRDVLKTAFPSLAGVSLAGCLSGDTATPTITPTTGESTATGNETPTEAMLRRLKERARSVLRSLANGEYDAVDERTTGTLAEQVSPATLEEVWKTQTDGLGSFSELTLQYRGSRGGVQLLAGEARFERGVLDVEFGFSSDGLAGLVLRPGGEYSPPEYADQSAFTETEVTLSAPGDCSLGATLTLPIDDEQLPGVVLVHGNGPNDRNESVGPNRMFKDLAWGLASRGIAVLRYDKRTFACEVNTADATVGDITTDDAVTAIERLRRRERVGPVFVAGHSIGGTLAPRIAKRADVAGVVYMAPLARSYPEAIVDQTRYLAERDGTVTAQERRAINQTRAVAEDIRTLDIPDNETILYGGDEYHREFQQFDPTSVAANLTVPQLILQGHRDWQVTVEDDLAMWREALGDRQDVTIRTYPNLNHYLFPGEGQPTEAEYFQPSNVPEQVITDIATFLERS